jgi:hypothetical protein
MCGFMSGLMSALSGSSARCAAKRHHDSAMMQYILAEESELEGLEVEIAEAKARILLARQRLG